MRPNIDIPWSTHGRIKDYKQAEGVTLTEAYDELLRRGLETDRGFGPDSREIDDISADVECLSCGWSPAAVVLVGGEWECYNCGGDPDEPREIGTGKVDDALDAAVEFLAMDAEDGDSWTFEDDAEGSE